MLNPEELLRGLVAYREYLDRRIQELRTYAARQARVSEAKRRNMRRVQRLRWRQT